MTSIDHVTLEVSDAATAADFYATVLRLGSQVRVRTSEVPSTGFRGFTLGLDVVAPASVDKLTEAALGAGATSLKPPETQPWGGYSSVLQAPDGTVLKLATTDLNDNGAATMTIERVVLLLGVADVTGSKSFYVDRGMVVAKDYGSNYVEFEAGSGAVTLGLYEHDRLAGEFGVSPEGAGARRLAIGSDAGPFTDPDNFAWESI